MKGVVMDGIYDPKLELEFKKIKNASQRNKEVLIDNFGYTYTLKVDKRSASRIWRCLKRNKTKSNPIPCPVTVLEKNGAFGRRGTHLCQSKRGYEECLRIKRTVECESLRRPFDSPAKICAQVLNAQLGDDAADPGIGVVASPGIGGAADRRALISNLVQRTQRQRRKAVPSDPESANDEIDVELIADVLIGDSRDSGLGDGCLMDDAFPASPGAPVSSDLLNSARVGHKKGQEVCRNITLEESNESGIVDSVGCNLGDPRFIFMEDSGVAAVDSNGRTREYSGASRILLFSKPVLLTTLASAREWYVDVASTSVAAAPYDLLLSVHARCGPAGQPTPLAFAVVSSVRPSRGDEVAECYTRSLTALLARLPGEPRVRTVVADYDEVLWRSLRCALPGVELTSTFFYFTRCVKRKIGELGLGEAYNNNSGMRQLCKRLMALSLVPVVEVPALFDSISKPEEDDARLQLLAYFADYWVTGFGFAVRDWNSFNRPVSCRDPLEEFHARLLQRTKKGPLRFYKLVGLLRCEMASAHVGSANESPENCFPAFERSELCLKLKKLWTQYDNCDNNYNFNISRLLERVALLL